MRILQQQNVAARPGTFRSAPPRSAGCRPAYTLLEIVLVMAILVILASMVYPSFEAMYDDQKLTDGATKVRAAWAAARSRAINEGRPYRFAAMIGKGNYRVAPESGDFWTGSDAAATAAGDTPSLVQSATLP